MSSSFEYVVNKGQNNIYEEQNKTEKEDNMVKKLKKQVVVPRGSTHFKRAPIRFYPYGKGVVSLCNYNRYDLFVFVLFFI